MNLNDADQVELVRSLFERQYEELLPVFGQVIIDLRDSGHDISLSQIKQLARERTASYSDQYNNAATASRQEMLLSDLIADEPTA